MPRPERGPLAVGSTTRPADEGLRDQVLGRLREAFRPEFLNPIDEIVVFSALDAEQLRQITDLLLEEPAPDARRASRSSSPRRRWPGWPRRGTSPSSGPGRCAG